MFSKQGTCHAILRDGLRVLETGWCIKVRQLNGYWEHMQSMLLLNLYKSSNLGHLMQKRVYKIHWIAFVEVTSQRLLCRIYIQKFLAPKNPVCCATCFLFHYLKLLGIPDTFLYSTPWSREAALCYHSLTNATPDHVSVSKHDSSTGSE
jgi:hypothetical protein